MSTLQNGVLLPVVTPAGDVAGGMRPEVIITSMPPITTGDIEIGAVEIKNSTDDTRATVGANGLYVDVRAPIVGNGYTSQLTLTRTSDTNAYGGGDVIGSSVASGGAVLTFANAGPAAGHIIITDVDLLIKVTAIPSGMTSFRLHLYNATIPSALGDNAAWDLPAGDCASYLGYVDLGTPVDVGSNLFVQTGGVNKKVLMGASTSLFGYLVTNGGYTPSSAAVKLIRLNSVGV